MQLIAQFCASPVLDQTLDVFLAATATADRYQLAYWDAAIIEGA